MGSIQRYMAGLLWQGESQTWGHRKRREQAENPDEALLLIDSCHHSVNHLLRPLVGHPTVGVVR